MLLLQYYLIPMGVHVSTSPILMKFERPCHERITMTINRSKSI